MFRATHLKTVTVLVTICSMIIINAAPVYGISFSDVSGYWARDSIVRLASLQIVNGFNGKFNPGGGVTRAEFAAMIVRALGMADQAETVKGIPTGYSDVAPGHWAAGFIVIARELGIISGYPDNTFQPSAPIRRDEITSVLVRALGISSADWMADPVKIFTDGDRIPGWAADAVKTAYNYKLISGFPDKTFNPQRNATRGETAVMIEKVLQQLDAEFTFYGKIQSIDLIGRAVTLDIQGQTETFTYLPAVEIRIQGNPAAPTQLQQGSNAFIVLDQDGNINYIQVEDVLAHAQSMKIPSARNIPAIPENGGNSSAAPGSGGPGQDLGLNKAADPNTGGRTGDSWVGVIAVTKPGAAGQVSDLIRSRGGQIKFSDQSVDVVCATVKGLLYEQLKVSPLVEELALDRQIKVKDVASPAQETSNVTTDISPGNSLNVTKEAIKAPEFVRVTHSDGKNQVIAVIDTGVDPGHPDLRKTSDNKPKIIDYRDFTRDGDIDTSSTAKPSDGIVYLANGLYYLGSIVSAGGQIRYGYLREVDIVDANGNGYDLNFNGSENDVFALILADSSKKGIFDTVYVDTNGNKDFSDEKPLHLFATGHEYASFTANNDQDRLNFALSEIAADNSKINLGFDGNDHGTHVAGIAAANGKIKGVAPGAQIMALKVLDAAGYGDLSTITEAMTYAASHGAKIINLSLGFPVNDNSGGSIPAKLLENLTQKYGVIFIVAAGNDGPGLSSVNIPDDATAALSVGAFITPEMWKADYGWDVPEEGLWFFSSMGPNRNGAVSPSIVAPGSVVSTVPMRNGKQYFLSEGTSMAAPHVSGAIALLMEVADRENLNVAPQVIKRAIELGARQVSGYQPAEQGYGALNLTMSWAELLSLHEARRYSVRTNNPDTSAGAGIFFRDGLPQRTTIYLTNNSGSNGKLKLNGSSWIKPEQNEVSLPAGKTRAVDIEVTVPEQKGMFSAFIKGANPDIYGDSLEVMATVINPYEIMAENDYRVKVSDTVGAAQFKRYFFRVPAGAQSIKAQLTVPQAAGRSKVFLYSPQGHLVGETEFAGVNPNGSSDTATTSANYPSPGIWEAVVYTSAGLSAYNLQNSSFSLEVSLDGVRSGAEQQTRRNVIIGVIPQRVVSGLTNYVTVQVRDRNTKRPFEGFIEIDGRLYFTRGGHVTLPWESQGDLVVRTVEDSALYTPWEFKFYMSTAG